MNIKEVKNSQIYQSFVNLTKELSLDGPRKLAKALNIKEKDAKELLNGNFENYSLIEVIGLIKALIALR